MKISIIISILISFCFNNGIFSQLNQNSIFFSINNYIDKIEYENINNEIIDINSKMYRVNIGYVYKGKYEFYLTQIKNNSNVNNYYLYESDSYSGINFYYYFNNFNKFPIDFKVGANYISSNTLKTNSFLIYFYKELAGGGNYPILPFLK